MLEIVRRAIVPFAVIGSMTLFKRMFPARKSGHTISEKQLDALDERFAPLRARVIGAMIAIALTFLFGTWAILWSSNRFLANMDGPATFRFFPAAAIWWFFPGFGAMALCWELTLQIWALFGDRETVNLFSDGTNQSTIFWGTASAPGMDSRKVLRWLTLIEGFSNTDGALARRAGIVLDFKDGRRWSSADWEDKQDTVDPAFANFLISRTGLPLNFATTEKDIPPLSELMRQN